MANPAASRASRWAMSCGWAVSVMITSGSFPTPQASARSMSGVRLHRLDRLALDLDRDEAYSSFFGFDPEVIRPMLSAAAPPGRSDAGSSLCR